MLGNLILMEKFKNVTEGGVEKLVLGYPSHGFVIDRKEARAIFNKVSCPDENEISFLIYLYATYPKDIAIKI